MTNLKEEREAIAEFIAESKLSRMETAMKVRELLLSHEEKVRDERDTYWKEMVRKEVEGIRKEIVNTCFYIDKKGFCKECIIKKYNQILDTRLENLTKGE